jgi:cellulose synthase/poly-beta-1,6-N-acetylglucosamine synthase-like glycosyltransferase
MPPNNIYMTVTLVVAAYNEEEIIQEKINNCLTLDYPADKINFIFITDGSTDKTASIINKYPIIVHLHEDERKGKLAAMNRAMNFVETEIVIFTDANAMLNSESIGRIVAHYADEKSWGCIRREKDPVVSE